MLLNSYFLAVNGYDNKYASNTSITLWGIKMKISKLTSKYQATIPKEIRESLKLNAGDSILFHIGPDGTITVRRAQPVDYAYLQGLDKTLSEWTSDEDDRAYEHIPSGNF